MRSTFIMLVCLIVQLGIAGNAFPLAVSIHDNVPDHLYIPPGTVVHGEFDLSTTLSNSHNPSRTSGITGGTYTLSFSDDIDRILSGKGLEQRITSIETIDQSTHITINTFDYFYDEPEWILTEVGGKFSLATSKFYSTSSYDPVDSTTYHSDVLSFFAIYYHLYNYDRIWGWSGDITIRKSLDTNQIFELYETGNLEFTIFPITGDLIYNRGTLDLEISTSPVPEPSTFFLALTGLVGLYALRRRWSARKR